MRSLCDARLKPNAEKKMKIKLFASLFIFSLLLQSGANAVEYDNQKVEVTVTKSKPSAINANNFYRDIWEPTYHILRLNYCNLDGKECGLAVASRYCRLLGYQRADKEMKANNIGLTRFLASHAKCQGWECDGFKMIRCVGKIDHEPAKAYHYRLRRFVYPRFEHFRVDWCYENEQKCGKPAAYSFCRKMGYLRTKDYKKQPKIAATKTLGNQKLCFGKNCNGFEYITCYR